MRVLIGACALLWAVSATSQVTEKQPLTLAQALASVLENNPQLQAADFDNRAAAARIRQQSQSTPWEVGIDLENLGSTGESSGIRGLETTLNLGRILELGNKDQLRGQIARIRGSLLRNEQDVERLDLLTETTKRFLVIAHIQAQQKHYEERIVLKQRTLKDVERRFKLGKAPKADHSRAQIDLERAKLELEETRHQLAVARKHLAILWGELTPEFQMVQSDLYRLDSVPDHVSLEALVEQSPSLARFATQQRLVAARIRLAKALRRPDVALRGGLRHNNTTDDFGLVFSVSIPLDSRVRAKPKIDELAALSAREPLLAENQRLALRSTLFGLRQELIHARHVVETLQGRIIPAAKSMLDDYSRGYNAGRYSLLELTQTQNTLLQARLAALNAAADYQHNRTEIDRLTAGALHHEPNTGVYR